MKAHPIFLALAAAAAMTSAIAASAGCGAAGGGGVIDDLCDRADECNILGTSKDECIEYMDQCTGELTPSQRAEWEHAIEDCLDHPTCGGAVDCYNQVPWC